MVTDKDEAENSTAVAAAKAAFKLVANAWNYLSKYVSSDASGSDKGSKANSDSSSNANDQGAKTDFGSGTSSNRSEEQTSSGNQNVNHSGARDSSSSSGFGSGSYTSSDKSNKHYSYDNYSSNQNRQQSSYDTGSGFHTYSEQYDNKNSDDKHNSSGDASGSDKGSKANSDTSSNRDANHRGETNKDEAEKAMAEAEELFKANDLRGANRLASKAETLFPSHPQIPRLLAALRVHMAAASKPSAPALPYWCGILGSDPNDDIRSIKQQFKKMCLLSHPDKNSSAAAEGAFKLVTNAWEYLSKYVSSDASGSDKEYQDCEETDSYQAEEDIQEVYLEFDGASRGNPGRAGAGAVLKFEDGAVITRVREGLGIGTNNDAEYRALIRGLKTALDMGYDVIHVKGDSKLVCKQIRGEWRIRSNRLARYCDEAWELIGQFKEFDIEHCPRSHNTDADREARRAVNLPEGRIIREDNWD